MNGTPSLDQALEDASTLTTETDEQTSEVTEEVETPTEQTEEATEETQETPETQEDEETTEETDDDGFIKGSDEDLTPEMAKLKAEWNRAYTQQRQKDREELRQMQKQMAELKKASETEDRPLTQAEFNQLSDEQKQEYLIELGKREAAAEAESQRAEEFKTTALQQYQNFDDRLNSEHENYDPVMDAVIGSQLDELLVDYVTINGSEQGFDVQGNLKELQKNWDEYLLTYAQQYVSKQNERRKANREKAKVQAPPKKTGKTAPSKMGLDDALEYAFSNS